MWVIYGARPGKVGTVGEVGSLSKVSNGGRAKRAFFFSFLSFHLRKLNFQPSRHRKTIFFHRSSIHHASRSLLDSVP